MIRAFFAVAAIALGVGVALAQQDPIAARRALMKANGDEAKMGAAMAKGEAPFDLAKARKMFATFEDASAKAPALFPDNSKTGGDTAAKPEIWETMDDFKARLVKLGADAKAAARERDGSRFLQGGFRQHRQERLRRLSREVPRQEELTSRDHAAFAPPKASSTPSAPTAIRLAGASPKPDLALAREWAEKTNIVRKLSRRMRTVTLIAAGILVAAARCRLDAHLAGDRSGVGIAGIHPQRRQRQDDVQRRRLRVLPRHARRRSGQGGSYAPRRRARA